MKNPSMILTEENKYPAHGKSSSIRPEDKAKVKAGGKCKLISQLMASEPVL